MRAINGEKPYKKKHTKILGVGPGTVSLFHIATYKSSGITKLSQLEGKRFSFARKGSNTYYMTDRVVTHAGLNVRKETMNWNVSADVLKDGRIDAFSIPNPVPSPAMLKAATAAPINLIPLEGKVLEKLLMEIYLKVPSKAFPSC